MESHAYLRSITVSLNFILVVGIALLIGLNLRPSMAAIGPLVELIQRDLGLSYSGIALLTTLPVMAMALGCFIGLPLAKKFSHDRLIGLSLLLIALADFARLSSDSLVSLSLTALLSGSGIAFIQVLMPSLIKQQMQELSALVMGWYIAAIMAGAALSASLAPALADAFGGWRGGLAIWGLLALLAWVCWLLRGPALAQPPRQVEAVPQQVSLWKQQRVWTLGLFFGLGTAGYTCILAWLPPFYIAQGWSSTQAGVLLGYLTGVEVLSGLTLPLLALRNRDRRPSLLFALSAALAGFLLLWRLPDFSPYLIATLLGIGIGGLFPLSMIVSMDHHPSPERAGAITGIVQGVGYFIASLSPLAAGMLRDQLGSFSLAWACLAGLLAGMILLALRFDPRHYAQVIRP